MAAESADQRNAQRQAAARAKAWSDWNAALLQADKDYQATLAALLNELMTATSGATSLYESAVNRAQQAEVQIMAPAEATLKAAIALVASSSQTILGPAAEAYQAAAELAMAQYTAGLQVAQKLYADQTAAATAIRNVEMDEAKRV